MKKRNLGIAAALLLSIGLLSACGSKSDAKDKDSKSDSGEVTLWTPFTKPQQTVSSWHESPFHTGLEKLTGIKVDWQFPTEGTDSTQAFNLMMSEKDLPNIICNNFRNDADALIKDGVIYDLTKLLPEKAPNYWKFLQEHPDFDKAMRTDSGAYYAFGFFRGSPNQSFIGPMVRKDWLDDNNMKMPESIADWEATFKLFKEKYGATVSWVNDKMDPGFAGAFGAYATALPTYYIADNSKIKFAQEQPEWKDYISWLNKMYKKGYIDPDTITMDDQGLQTKVANDKIGLCFTYASRIRIFNDESKANGKTAEWAPTIYPNQADGSLSASIYNDGQVQGPAYVITKGTTGKTLDKALEWLDFAFTEKGDLYWNYGTEGKTYTMVDGKPQYTDLITKNDLGQTEARNLYTGNTGTGLGVQQFSDPKSAYINETWYNDNKDAAASRLNVAVTMTADESKEAATLTDSLNSYVNEQTYKFIIGDRSIDDDFDSFVQEMKDMGSDKLTKIKQDSYDRYLNR